MDKDADASLLAIDTALRGLAGYGIGATFTVGPDRTARLETEGHGHHSYAMTFRERVTPAVASALDTPGTGQLLVVAPHVSEAAADTLRGRGIDYVDLAGNTHVAWPGLLVDVRGRRRPPVPRPRSTAASRAFTRSGVRVVFVLLSWPTLLRRPLREIARASGVSLGTAQVVVEDLTDAGYLRRSGRVRTLARGGELLSRWAEAYATWLVPSLDLGAYAADVPGWWLGADADLDDAGAQLAGDAAAAVLDPSLHATTAVLYVDTLPTELVARHGMRPDAERADVRFRRRFWDVPQDASALVPAPLVYADLVTSGSPELRAHGDALRRAHDRLARLDRT